MSSLLVLTADPNSAHVIAGVAADASLRVRVIAEVGVASEWLLMQHFDVLLADSRYGDRTIANLFELCWKQNPLCDAAVFNLYSKISPGLTAQLLGARIFSGRTALAEIQELLHSVPQRDSSLTGHQLGVLLVDDLDAPRDIIRSYIEALGTGRVDAVGSVDEALELLHRQPNRFFCVITDFSMPTRSGIELISAIRSEKSLENIPVLVLTAYATGEALVESIKAGATGFLVKPPKKKALRFELEKAKRLFLCGQSPRLCAPEDAHLLEEAIQRRIS